MVFSKVMKTLLEWVIYLAISILLMLLIGIYLFQTTKVVGLSMFPTLENNQIVYVLKLNNTFETSPDYGEIVIIDSRIERDRTFTDEFYDSPLGQLFHQQNDHHLWIKRLIGKAGDEIIVKNQTVFRNGERLDEPYLNEIMMTSGEQKWVVPEGYVFVMGDNRNHSKDSREIGPVPITHILGKKL